MSAFSTDFSPSFGSPADSTNSCPPAVDWGCTFTEAQIAELDPVVAERSTLLAWSTLQALTGYQVSPCPVLVRPCSEGCSRGTWRESAVIPGWGSTGGGFTPYISSGGYWVNSCGCGQGGGCSCTTLSEVILPGPIGAVVEVLLDGVVISPSDYRVDNSNRLVALNGVVWPGCQDMSLAEDQVGTFSVRYFRGFAPDPMTTFAAGVLAGEYYKACTNAKGCRLPSGVTSISRQGVTFEVQTDMFVNGYTGIREVDTIIGLYNPSHLRQAAVIASPDTVGVRTPTWRW